MTFQATSKMLERIVLLVACGAWGPALRVKFFMKYVENTEIFKKKYCEHSKIVARKLHINKLQL